MRGLYLFIIAIFSSGFLFGQSEEFKPDMSRALFHSKLDNHNSYYWLRMERQTKKLLPIRTRKSTCN
jgi:hypothetical protein